jgi:GTPase
MLIDTKYYITGHGTVVCGLLKTGTIKVNDTLYLGPSRDKNIYLQTKVKSIHIKHLDVKEAKAGSYICVCLKNINKKNIRKGSVLVCDKQQKLAIYEFTASINILHSHHTTIRKGYEPYLHIEQVRQCAKILEINNHELLRTGDTANIRLQFMNYPEYIKPGMNLIFRDGKVKGIGKILEIY